VDTVSEGLSAAAIVLTTTCDQIRYTAALLEHLGKLPVFLMHVPRTWQTASTGSLYCEELRRLGRFLVDCGGTQPSAETLCKTMLCYDRARAELRGERERMSAREFAEAVARVRGDIKNWPELGEVQECEVGFNSRQLTAAGEIFRDSSAAVSRRLSDDQSLKINRRNLAIVGGPMTAGDGELLQIIENAGGRIVLDATESGERTLPAPFDADRLQDDPLGELVRAYFDVIPDVFRRPNDLLHTWLRREVAARGVHGVLLRRYVWCDLWHAELPRFVEESSVPVFDWEIADEDAGDEARTLGRLEAFLEMLQ
jgi:benzoyl-CoA reductase/2-hydroxyglutaryl-CoA dehydratase subunit BcrC/BadD/HgdB